jgi:WD40 repeat protein
MPCFRHPRNGRSRIPLFDGDYVYSLVVHGDKLISGSRDHTIKVWSTDTWACERTLEGHTNSVTSLVVHGDKLFSGSGDETVKVWGAK